MSAAATRALVVDDHPVNRFLLARQLAALGCDVETAVDGTDALNRWQAHRHPLVVLDCAMPGMDGCEVARRVRALEAALCGRRTLLVACTAHCDPEVERRCLQAGMDAVLVKPCDARSLAAVLEERGELQPSRPAGAGLPEDECPQPVDLPRLAQDYRADPAFAQVMLEEFVAASAADGAALRGALARRDVRGVVHNAHRLLGAARMVSARELARAAAHLESIAPAGDWRRIEASIAACEHACARIAKFAAALGSFAR